MDSYELFKEDVKKCAEEFRKIPKNEIIRVISHLDADGISSASLLVKYLNNDNRKYSISIIQQVEKDVLESIAREPYKYVVFSDIGSNALTQMEELFKDRLSLFLTIMNPRNLRLRAIFFL